MADETPVIPVQCFYDDQYGWVEAHTEIKVSAETAKRWIEEDKAKPPPETGNGGH